MSSETSDKEKFDLENIESILSKSSSSSETSILTCINSDLSPVISDRCRVEVSAVDPVTERREKLYNIACRLTSSEVEFRDILNLLDKDFRLMASQHIPDDFVNQLVPHTNQLVNISEMILSDFEERLANFERDQKIANVLKKYGQFLNHYSLYMKDFYSMMATINEAQLRYPAFANALKDFESSDRCHNCPITMYMLKPIQRIRQYRLLLTEYIKTLNGDKEHPDYADAQEALKIVSDVTTHAIGKVDESSSLHRLLHIQENLVVTRELIKPGRKLIKEGDLFKLSSNIRKCRYFVLCSDCLLYIHVVRFGTFKLKHEIALTGMRLKRPTRDHDQLEFVIISTSRSFKLAANSTRERNDWLVAIDKAINDDACRLKTFHVNT